jgi:uncharacterized protein (DUF58 family)
MIVPRSRLLWGVVVVVLPGALLGAVQPAAAGLCWAGIGVLLLLAVADALAARRGLSGITVHLPAVARMSKNRVADLEVRIRNEPQQARHLRVGLVLPRDIEASQDEAVISLPRGCEWSRFSWNVRPGRRGRYHLDSARLETPSPFGLWAARTTTAVNSELRVYPNLFRERRDLAALFLHRGSFGLHAHRQIGKGREFEKLREYVPGDGYDEIHWKATAKRGRPITKIYQIERTQEVYVVIDASRLSGRMAPEEPGGTSPPRPGAPGRPPAGPTAETKPTTLERFITAGLVLGLAAEQQGDLFGLLAFTDKVETFVRARNGKAHYSACRDALYTLEPRTVTPDYEEVFTFIRLRLRRRALLVFLTALDDPVLAETFVRSTDLIRRQHLVLVNMLPPAGVQPLFSDSGVGSVDDLYERLGGHLRWQNLRELEKVLHRRGVAFSLLKDERLSTQLVSQYLGVKRRQAL